MRISIRESHRGASARPFRASSVPHVVRICARLLVLGAFALGATLLRAGPLHLGTTTNDVQAHSFGFSNASRAVGAAPDGTIYVGFFSADGTQIRIASSSDRGATFAPSVLVDTAGVGNTFGDAWLTVSSAGDVFVAYIDSSSKVWFARSSNAGVTFTPGPSLGTTSASFGVRVATTGSYVHVAYAIPGGVAVASSSDGGVSFAPPVTVVITGGNIGLLVDQSNADVVVAAEFVSLYLRVSHDHGATFDLQQQPAGQVFFADWTISSDVSGRHLWVAGSENSGSDNAYQIDLSNFSSVPKAAFLNTTTALSRSLFAVGCGDIVDSVAGSWAAVHDFGATIGTTYPVGGPDQTTAVNPNSGDVLIAYSSGTDIKLDVYENEITGCGPHVSATIDDGHVFARIGKTLNYLVTVSDEFAAVNNVAVNLATPGTALDLVHATWECIGSDNTVICPASSGTGLALGSVSLQPASTMTWLVSVPVLAAATEAAAELDVSATGAGIASDVDTLVIFRSGFDVNNSDGTQ